MRHIKHIGFLQIGLHRITKINEDARGDIDEKLVIDLITLLAKHDVITDSFIFDFISTENCEQKDIINLSLIKKGMEIEGELNR
ncbi:hypothetical protein [Bacillus sp. J37]|uniref:hypothetical protein n=1 Tax=Bacillus sp. J37 TaxID=935837 RepID=UPI00047AFA43|nr:hypothetical protein [Bacillus sp. J37]